jgi:hypothetical protein
MQTFEQCMMGIVDITERPNGDDEWHFHVNLLLEFERGSWINLRWTDINLAEDRPHWGGHWVI